VQIHQNIDFIGQNQFGSLPIGQGVNAFEMRKLAFESVSQRGVFFRAEVIAIQLNLRSDR
jgi:hypothetical protein